MTRGRLVTLAAAGVLAIGAGIATAAPVSVHPTSVQVSSGNVTITRTSVDDGQEVDYAVSFVGPLKVHGWTHTGTMTGTSSAYVPFTFNEDIPNFNVATRDGVVTGQCGGAPDNEVDDTTGVDVSDTSNQHVLVFDCVLSHGGGTPWQVRIDTKTKMTQQGANTDAFSGTYRLVDAETSLVGIDGDVTYGDAQFIEYTDDGGGVQWGPLRLSGQIMIGSTRYRGDLISAVGPYGSSDSIPDMTVSGSADGLTVSGDCSGVFDSVFDQVEWTFDFTCNLSVNGGAATTVKLRTTYPGGGGRCRERQCWSDYAGYFTTE